MIPVGAALGLADSLIGLIGDMWETDEEKARAKVAVISALSQVDLANLQLNMKEAEHPSIFVAGWRPSIGWTCAFAVFYQFVLHPLISWVFLAAGLGLPPLPTFDTYLWELMAGMLGIAGLRSYDKLRSTDTRSIG